MDFLCSFPVLAGWTLRTSALVPDVRALVVIEIEDSIPALFQGRVGLRLAHKCPVSQLPLQVIICGISNVGANPDVVWRLLYSRWLLPADSEEILEIFPLTVSFVCQPLDILASHIYPHEVKYHDVYLHRKF